MNASILTFRAPGVSADDLASELVNNQGFRCRLVSERGLNAVRVSWHVYNNADQTTALAEAVAQVLADLGRKVKS